jgi:transcriptional regulator with XRE-family HTH domain
MARKNDHKILVLFGHNLKKYRKAKGLSLRQLAALTGIDHSMIDKYEHAETNATLSTVARLAEALEIEPHELLMKKG